MKEKVIAFITGDLFATGGIIATGLLDDIIHGALKTAAVLFFGVVGGFASKDLYPWLKKKITGKNEVS